MRFGLGVLGIVVVMSAPRVVEAQKKPILVLESHVGGRPAALASVMSTLDDVLETYGFAAKPATILRIAGKSVPRPGILDPNLTQAEIAQHFNEGWTKFGEAKWDEASKALTRMIDEVRRNPGLVVNDMTNVDLTFRAHVALAVCQQRQLDAGAAGRTMVEAIRSFPSRPVSRSEAWGKEGEKLYTDYSKQVQAMGRGRLVIAAGHGEAQIFVEGQLRGIGNASIGDLVPGDYSVFIRVGRTIGRQYEVQVSANDDAYLKVEAELDSSLWVSDTWVGFQFATEAARANESKYAEAVARRWTGDPGVILLATSRDKGRPVLEGVRYRNGAEVRRARIYTDAPEAGGANKLALFLVDGKSGDGIEILRSDESAPASPKSGHRWRLRSKLVLGGGAIALVASGIGFAVTKDDGLETFTAKDFTLDASYGASAIVGAGVFMWLRDTKSTSVGTSLLLGGGLAALISGGILLATDEDQQADRKYFRDTSTEGMIVGGVGVALTGIGTVLFVRQRGVRNDRADPVVSLVNGRGYVGLAGQF